MNKAFLLGNLGKDPETKNLDSGQTLTKFPLATSRKYKNKDGEVVEDTTWHNIIVWGKLGDTCGKYLTKGRQVLVEGEIRTRSYEQEGVKKYTTEIVAQNVQFLGGGNKAGEAGGGGGISFDGDFDEGSLQD